MDRELSDKFHELQQEINGTAPDVLLCRDWLASLAGLGEELAIKVEENPPPKRILGFRPGPNNAA